jgi:hypothetical protein
VPVENLVVVVTLASLLLYFWTCARVASARARNKILAPTVTGHPEFERASEARLAIAVAQQGDSAC